MTQAQTNKILYLVSILAFVTLIISLYNVYYLFHSLLEIFKHYFLKQMFFYIYLLIMITSPFIKYNKVLFLVPIDIILNGFGSFSDLYLAIFNKAILANFGIIPGYLNPLAIFLLDSFGLLFLVLRLYRYLQEKKLDKASRF